jgi:CubicO group peptidase (beta-lactamase class C family)
LILQGYGIATYPDTAVTPETLFFTGSTTKAFTSAALSFLVEDNENYPGVKWDTPVADIIRDDFVMEDDWYTNHITLEDAASHRSGLPRHDISYPENVKNVTTGSWVRLFRYLPLTAAIRTRFQYCNLMYVALSHVLETLVKKPLGDFITEKIWAPLNMTSTTYHISKAQELGHIARGYLWIESKCQPRYAPVGYLDLSAVAGAGFTISTVNDYAKWTYSLLHRLRPLSRAQHQAIMTPRTMVTGDSNPLIFDPLPFVGPYLYSLGWEQFVYRGELFIGHDGGLPGFGARLLMIPSRNWGVVMMGNTGGTSNMAEVILTFNLIDDFLGVPQEERYDWAGNLKKGELLRKIVLDQVKDALFPNVPSPPIPHALRLKEYAGTYWHPAYASFNLTYHAYFDNESPEGADGQPSTNKFVEYLHAFPSDRPWNFTGNLYHVSGDYFLLDAISPWPHGTNITKCDGLSEDGMVTGKGAARFVIGPDGKVQKAGIMLEGEMVVKAVTEGKNPTDDSAMLWFDKVA